MSKKLIQALEPRVMLDGAAVATALDTIDELTQSNKIDEGSENKSNKFKAASDTKLPFVNGTDASQNSKSKQVIFIDSAVEDIDTLIKSFDDNAEIHVIQSNQDGFVEIQKILSDETNVDALHIIGHGSVGQIAFGTAVLNSDTLDAYEDTLIAIGLSLCEQGDILFYGCNVAADQNGEIFINQIADITQADVAASDDVTGKGGDWDLEKHTGIIEAKNIDVVNYGHSLANGVASVDSSVVEIHDATNYRARWSGDNDGGQQDPSSDRFIISQERADVTGGAGTLNFDVSGAKSSHTPSASEPVHVYLLFSNDDTDSNSRRSGSRTGVVTFENDILGVFTSPYNTIAMTGISKSGASYPTASSDKIGMRDLEYKNDNAPGQQGNKDWFRIYNSNRSIEIGTKNGLKGDFIRVITRAPVVNNEPVGNNDTGAVNEDASVSVSSGSGVLSNDTDADGDSLTVSAISGGSLGSALDGTYGQLTMSADGSYTYTANRDAADPLDPGDTVTDTFTYTVSDGTDTDTATLTITITGVNDPITAVNDTDAVNEDATINRSTSDSQELDHDDTDPDADDASGSFTITAIRTGRESATSGTTAGTIGQALNGTYGVLTLAADGSYSYAATRSGADALAAGATAIDYFTYTVRDHSSSPNDTDTAELAITVTGVGPSASNDTGSVNERATLTANAGAGVIANDTGGDTESLAVTNISSNATGNSGNAAQGVLGTYGTLTVAADGSYTYVANTAAAEALDAGDEVTDVFTYTVKDDDDVNSDTATLTITVTGIDNNPVGNNDAGAINEDKTLTVSAGSGVLSNDTDADASSSLSVSAISGGTVGQALNGTYGVLTLSSDGSYTYVANGRSEDGLAADATATDTFTYTVSDGAGTTDTADLVITVTGVGPQAVADTGAVNEDATLTVNEASGVISNDDDNASFDVESLAITGISHGVTGNSGNAAQAVTGTYGVLTMAADGSYEYVANQAAADALDPSETATDVFTYTVKDDADKNASTATLTITVTGLADAITAVDDTDAVNAGSAISRSTSDTQELDHDDTDDDGDDVPGSLTITAIRTGQKSGSGDAKTLGQSFTTTYGTVTINADGSYSYAANQSGAMSLSDGATAVDYFTYTVRDQSGNTSNGQLAITVTGIDSGSNNAPVANNDTGAVDEDATLTVNAASGAESNDTDPDGDDIEVHAIAGGSVGSGVTGTYGTLTLNDNGSYTYVADQAAADALDAGDQETDVFTYTLRDDGTPRLSDTATITITVTGVDDDPVGVNDAGAVNEDATLSVNAGSGVLSNDTDADASSSLSVSGINGGTVGQELTGTYGTLTLNSDGSYSYAANTAGADGLAHGATATDTFTYTVSDGAGTTDTANLVITVTGVGPVGSADTATATENQTLSVNAAGGVLTNDTGGDTESLAVTNVSSNGTSNSGAAGAGVLGTYGTLTVAADGSYTYIANTAAAEALDAGDSVTEVFTYTVKDDEDKNSSTATLTVTINGANDAIVAVDDTDSVDEGATISRTVSDPQELDHDDTDVDGDDASGNFTITDIRTGPKDGNGTDGTVGVALTGEFGTLTVNADGSYTYVADQTKSDQLVTGQTGTDTFTYTVSDGTATSTANLTFTVTGINDNDPVAVDDTDSVNRDATISRAADTTFDINADDTDADGETLTITEVRTGQVEGGGRGGSDSVGTTLVGTYGTLTLNADGSYTYVADQDAADSLKRGDSAIDYFNYSVSDGSRTDTGVIAITVNGISDPPVPVDDTLAIDAGATGTKNATKGVLSNDTDPDGDTLSVNTIRTGEEAGTGTSGTIGSPLTGTYGDLTMNADGSYEYAANNAKELNPGDTATEYFTYTATDGESSVEAQIAITVTGQNDPPEVINPVEVPILVQGQRITIRHKQIFDDPDTGIYDIAEYKIIDPETEAETSLPEGLSLRENKLTGRLSEPGTYTITIRAIDGAGLYADHTFTITVIPNVILIEEPDLDLPGFELDPIKPIKVKPAKTLEVINEVDIIDNEGFTLDTISIADTASLSKPLKFNGGLRLMDAVASDVSTNNDNIDLAVGVKLNDDNQKNVELYSGQLADGQALPDWISVNPETGETTATMPDGVDEIEVQLVALDKDGNTRDINIVLDKAKIQNDQDFTRGVVGQTRVIVDNDANVNLIREDNGRVNNAASNNLNANADFVGNMKLSSLQMDSGKYTLDIIDDNQSNVRAYKAQLKDGSALPDWVTIDPKTGAISADPSLSKSDISVPSFIADVPTVLELKIIAEDEDGNERTIEVEINLDELPSSTEESSENSENSELSFIPLNDQLKTQAQQTDSYGEKIMSLVS